MKSLINVIGLIVGSFLCSFKKENPISFTTTTIKAPFGIVSVKARILVNHPNYQFLILELKKEIKKKQL
jgi:hypothetical protein